MVRLSRRELLEGLGGSAVLASLAGIGWSRAVLEWSDDERLDFGDLEPLVALLQESEADALMEALVERLRGGLDLKRLVAAGALANARTFGGEDYTGYHCAMALVPAWDMAQQLPDELRPLPVLKVLHRNTSRIRAFGGRAEEVLRPVPVQGKDVAAAELKRALTTDDVDSLERKFAAFADRPQEMYEALQGLVQDAVDVHRVVLAWRAWDCTRFAGQEHAHTLLRQSLRFCAQHEAEQKRRGHAPSELRELLPRLFEEYKLGELDPGSRAVDERWIAELAQTIFSDQPAAAAEAVAASLAAGFGTEPIGEALSLAGTRLLLHDPGRHTSQASPEKPVGSVHGASTGVHASDAALAWRRIAGATGRANALASMIAGAFHTAGQSSNVARELYPFQAALEELDDREPAALLGALTESVAAGDQPRAGACAWAFAEAGGGPEPFFAELLQHALQADGALHAEKYFSTAQEVCASAQPGFRREHMVAAARVCASQTGHVAPGLELARELLG